MEKAVFFDRDGIINKRILGGYVRSWSEFVWMNDVAQTLRAVKDLGYLAIIITNQRGVGLGLMSEADLTAIHAAMQQELKASSGVAFDDIISCTDASNDSPRRKPSPEMIFEAAVKWNIDLSQSWFVGDSPSDIEAGSRAGTKTAFLLNEFEEAPSTTTVVIETLPDLLKHLDR